MKQVKAYPPNFELIKLVLNPPHRTFYCYGETVYNPSGQEIPEDILFHESIHSKQQGETPEQWWNRYLQEKDFRQNQEEEAYAHQFNFIKKHYPQKVHKWALTDLANNLRTIYNLDISLQEAESHIRNKAKTYVTS